MGAFEQMRRRGGDSVADVMPPRPQQGFVQDADFKVHRKDTAKSTAQALVRAAVSRVLALSQRGIAT